MFTTKKTQLFDTTAKTPASTNKFINAGMNERKRKAVTTTALGNGAVKLTTTGNDFVDQFGKASIYKAPRSFAEIAADMVRLWGNNKLKTVLLTFYFRMITRQTVLPNGQRTETTQRGQGLKHEGIFRMMWLAINQPQTFWKNIPLFIAVGSWKDIITMLSYDLQYNGWEGRQLDWQQFGQLLLAGLENDNSTNLIKKYLPQIKSNAQCKTVEAQADNIIAKWICSLLFGAKAEASSSYKQYRKLKTSGNAHEWQQLISQRKMLKINFSTIHGRALAQLVSGKFLKNNNLEAAYTAWIEKQPIAKYTGYPYELFAPLGLGHHANTLSKYQEDTINKQFLGLIETAKKGMDEGGSTFITVIDSSGSMTSPATGTKVSAYSVAKSMALYFSYLLKGAFQDHFLEFSDTTVLKTWNGKSPVEKYRNERSAIVAGTNFQSVADHFGRMLQRGVPESDFPNGILCVSDGCFNSAGANKSNFDAFMARLRSSGFSSDFVNNFKVVLWDIPNSYYGKPQTVFEDFADRKNLFHISGLDPAAVAFITGIKGKEKVPTTSEELFEAAMDQEVLNMIQL